MKMEKYAPGQFSWIDLVTKDVDKAKSFYGSLFGWTPEDQTDPDGNYVYTMFYKGDAVVAGMGKMNADMRQSGMPCIWNNYVTTASVEETSKKVEAAGGKITMPVMDIFGSGRMGIFQDPTGAAFSVWEPQAHIGAGLVNEPGSFCWNELMTPDLDAAKTFYSEVFGWTFQTDDGEMPYTQHYVDGRPNGGAFELSGPMAKEVPPHWLAYLTVENIGDAETKLKELGGKVVRPVMTVKDVGTFAVVQDDQGATFSLIQLDP